MITQQSQMFLLLTLLGRFITYVFFFLVLLHHTSIATTYTPRFLGLNPDSGVWPELDFGDDVVIGIVDSGIWPEHPSFNDNGLRPINNSKWKGVCQEGQGFSKSLCNNKLIGARFFSFGYDARFNNSVYLSPRDYNGHGSHVASIAAGAEVSGANEFGLCNGTARGMAPKARIAIYKACWPGSGCTEPDISEAFEAAVMDGVDILSVSLALQTKTAEDYHLDPISVASFAVVQKGILIVAAAGNNGNVAGSIQNPAPWILTVGASTTDRTFLAKVSLGNGQSLTGISYTSQTSYVEGELLYVDCASSSSLQMVEDKIVVCDSGGIQGGFRMTTYGAKGMLMISTRDDINLIDPIPFPLPNIILTREDGLIVMAYLRNQSNSSATLKFKSYMEVGKTRSPSVCDYSGRGPNMITPEVLKPDVIAPGDRILGAWVPNKPVVENENDARRSLFNIIRGTSMAVPHVAGIAALLLKAHPTWSPATIRSAIMTTAAQLDYRFSPILDVATMKPATPFGFGSGLVQPQASLDPGLVYDANSQDYINFLCSLNYTPTQLELITNLSNVTCSNADLRPSDLNYPSFSVKFDSRHKIWVQRRTLTNVVELHNKETYNVRVINPISEEVDIIVQPESLTFHELNENNPYTVEFRSKVKKIHPNSTSYIFKRVEFAMVIWESQEHIVRSPVALMWMNGSCDNHLSNWTFVLCTLLYFVIVM